MNKNIIFFIALLFSAVLNAQTVIEGTVRDSTGRAVDAYLTVSPKGAGNLIGFCDTDTAGAYRMEFRTEADSVVVTVAGLGIGQHARTVANRPQRLNFRLAAKEAEIGEVSVIAKKIRQEGDTIKYNVAAYRQQGDRVIGDVLKKMPGIEVTESGKIKYNGKTISKFYVEDMDLLQGRYGLATHNINAEDVTTVEVLENHQAKKALQGKVLTDDVALNLKLRNSAKGTVAVNAMAGGGGQQGGGNPLWAAEVVGMYFAKTRQHMTAYKGNNTGDNVAGELVEHYAGLNRVNLRPFCPMGTIMPPDAGLPPKRTYDNRTHILTANHLEKFEKDREVTASLTWQNDRVRSGGTSQSDIFLSGERRLLTSETLSSQTRTNRLDANLRYCRNAQDGFLSNVLEFNGGWNDDAVVGDLTSAYTGRNPSVLGSERVGQQFRRPDIAVCNTFNTILLTGKNHWDLHFSAGYAQRPNTLTVDIDSLFQGTSIRYGQDLDSRHASARFHTNYNLRLGDFTLTYGVSARTDMHGVRTELDGFLPPPSTDYDAEDILRNDLWYNNHELSLGQQYKYERRKWKVTLGCPLNLLVRTLDDRVRHSRHTHTYMLLSPSLSAGYTGREWQGSAGAAYSRNVSDPGGIYNGYIMHNYRSFQRSYTDQLSETDRIVGNAALSYRNILAALFLNLNAGYSYTRDNQIYGYDYEGATSVVQAVDRRTTANRYNLGFNASKGLGWMQTTLRLFGNYAGSHSERLIAGQIYPYRNENYSLGAGGTITPLVWLNFIVSSGFSWSRSFTDGSDKDMAGTVRASTQRIRMNLFPTQQLTLSVSVEDNYNNLTVRNRHVWFGDLQAKYKLKRVDLELAVNNIFNQKTYTRVSYNGPDIHTTTSELRSRNIIGTIRFKLL